MLDLLLNLIIYVNFEASLLSTDEINSNSYDYFKEKEVNGKLISDNNSNGEIERITDSKFFFEIVSIPDVDPNK